MQMMTSVWNFCGFFIFCAQFILSIESREVCFAPRSAYGFSLCLLSLICPFGGLPLFSKKASDFRVGKGSLRRKDERNYSRGHAGKAWDQCSAMYQWWNPVVLSIKASLSSSVKWAHYFLFQQVMVLTETLRVRCRTKCLLDELLLFRHDLTRRKE